MLIAILIFNSISLYLALEFIWRQKSVTVRNFEIEKTKQMRYDEALFSILAIVIGDISILNISKILTSILIIVLMLWMVKIIYERNHTALILFEKDSAKYDELRKNLWKEYMYIMPKVILVILGALIGIFSLF